MPCCDTAHFLRPSSCSRSVVWLSETKMRGSHGVLCDPKLTAGTTGVGCLALLLVMVRTGQAYALTCPIRNAYPYSRNAKQTTCRVTAEIGHLQDEKTRKKPVISIEI